MPELLNTFVDFFLHLDEHLGAIISQYGALTYAILFFIIFAETAFVVTPFLPGDSLLFAAGAFAALGSLNVVTLLIVLTIAAILGDTINYWIGHYMGDYIVNKSRIPINKDHIKQTEDFYAKHGGKTIILARFVPIVRTFAPFVAGVGRMEYSRFISFNVFGGIIWIFAFTLAGYFFGNIPAVKHNFEIVIFGIIGISVLPMFYHWVKSKRATSRDLHSAAEKVK
ncbi:DedA family protein [Patescibacteria group bacterium]